MADVNLQLIIPDAHTIKVLDAFNVIVDNHIKIDVQSSDIRHNDFTGSWDFRIDPKSIEETNKEFGERVLRELGKAMVHLVDKAEDRIRYRNEIDAIDPPASDAPEDVIQ